MAIAGHTKQQAALKRDLETGNLAHAYLFVGPPHVGKYSLARWVARALQCAQGGCNDCQICFSVTQGTHADTIEMSGDELLAIEMMRDTLARLSTTAVGRYKILLIKNIERMKIETANTLLKSLEEPASAVKFLFTSSAFDDILPTILSRVRTVKFQTLTSSEILKMLQEKHPMEDASKLAEVSDLAFGLPGRAVQLMTDPEAFERTKALFERIRNVVQRGDIVEKFALVEDVTKDKKDDPQFFKEFCDIFLLALRYRMIEAADGGTGDLARMTDAVLHTQKLLRLQKNNINARLAFENLMLQI